MATSQHNTWIKATARNLVCDLCNKAPHVLQKCVTCRKTICKNCFDSGKELDSQHSLTGQDLDWKPCEPVKKRQDQCRGTATLAIDPGNSDHMLARSQPALLQHVDESTTSVTPARDRDASEYNRASNENAQNIVVQGERTMLPPIRPRHPGIFTSQYPTPIHSRHEISQPRGTNSSNIVPTGAILPVPVPSRHYTTMEEDGMTGRYENRTRLLEQASDGEELEPPRPFFHSRRYASILDQAHQAAAATVQGAGRGNSVRVATVSCARPSSQHNQPQGPSTHSTTQYHLRRDVETSRHHYANQDNPMMRYESPGMLVERRDSAATAHQQEHSESEVGAAASLLQLRFEGL